MRLNLGCNTRKFKGFKNVDLDERNKPDIVADVSTLPFKDGAVKEIVASHIIEHFPHTRTDEILKEWHRVLKKDGVLWIMVPDFDSIFNVYKETGVLSEWLVKLLHGDQADKFQFHYVSFNYPTLLNKLYSVGYSFAERFDVFPYAAIGCWNLMHGDKRMSLNIRAVK